MLEKPDPTSEPPDETLDQLEQEFSLLFERLNRELNLESFHTDDWSVGKYRLLKLHGRGGQAYVFQGFDTELQRDVVVKLYPKTLSSNQRTQVLREGRAMSAVDHPNVAKCLAFENVNDTPFLVMEFVHGETLQAWAERVQPSPTRSLEMVCQIARGLQAVHADGFLHLDLKPSNIMVTRQGVARLIDFGLAETNSTVDESDSAGTRDFVAPERFGDSPEPPGVTTDIFGLGAVLYYLLTGNPPGDRHSPSGKPDSGQAVLPSLAETLPATVAPNLVQLCQRSLSANPQDRYADATNWLTAAELILGLRQIRRRSLLLLMASIALVVVPGSWLLMGWNENGVTAQPEATGPMRQRIREIFRRVVDEQPTGLVNDLPIQVELHLADGTRLQPKRDGTTRIPAEVDFYVEVVSPESCHIGIACFSATGITPGISHCDPGFPRDDWEMQHSKLAAGERRRLPDLRCTVNRHGSLEYLYVAVCHLQWQPDHFEYRMSSVQDQIRGISRSDDMRPLSEVLIPILVVQPAHVSPTELHRSNSQ